MSDVLHMEGEEREDAFGKYLRAVMSSMRAWRDRHELSEGWWTIPDIWEEGQREAKAPLEAELASLRRVLAAAEPLVPFMKKDYADLKRLTRNQERMRYLVEELARHRADFPVSACPFCGSDKAPDVLEDFDRQTSPIGWRVSCWKDEGGCEMHGPWAATEEEAKRLWNERA